jgi:hypothetical protein
MGAVTESPDAAAPDLAAPALRGGLAGSPASATAGAPTAAEREPRRQADLDAFAADLDDELLSLFGLGERTGPTGIRSDGVDELGLDPAGVNGEFLVRVGGAKAGR